MTNNSPWDEGVPLGPFAPILPVPETESVAALVNPVTRTEVKLDPPVFRGPAESPKCFLARIDRISAAFDALCMALWDGPYHDPVRIEFFKPSWTAGEADDSV